MSTLITHRCPIFLLALALIAMTIGCSANWPQPVKFGSLGRGADLAATNRSPAVDLDWGQSYDDAMAEAQTTDKPVLALFTGSDWCKYCIYLKRDVLESPVFANWAENNVVLLELDFPRNHSLSDPLQKQNERLQAEYNVSTFPTVLLLDSSGNVLGNMGYMKQADAWVSMADEKLRR